MRPVLCTITKTYIFYSISRSWPFLNTPYAIAMYWYGSDPRFICKKKNIYIYIYNKIIYINIYNNIYNTHICNKKKIYTGCIKKVGTLEYFEKYKFYQKMFQTKVVWFRGGHKMVSLVWHWRVIWRSREGHFNSFKWNTLYIFAHYCSLSRELSKTL